MRSGALPRSGLDPDTGRVFAMLRNAYPDRAVPLRNYRAAYVYQDPATFDGALARMIETGLVKKATPASSPESVVLSASGRDLMARIRQVGAQVADGRWGRETGPLLELVDRCLTRAAETAVPEGAFHLVAPRHDEPDDSTSARLAEGLTGLRFHRFDAHVAAWRAAGFTAASITALEPGPERDQIEADTNERAGQAYAALTVGEQSSLLQGLTELA